MKAIHLKCVTALAMSMPACACIPSVEAPAQTATPAVSSPPPPAITPLPPPPPPIISERTYENYLDAPQTKGAWSYTSEPSETLATFGVGTEHEFIVRCDKSNTKVGLGRVLGYSSATPLLMTVQAETVSRDLTARRVDRQSKIVAAILDPSDPLLDAMAITKGRIAIGVQGQYTLYLPAWVEISRVIEDCR